jgi:hypothetical protein
LNACSAPEVQNDPVVVAIQTSPLLINLLIVPTVKITINDSENLLNMMSLPTQRIPILQNQTFLNQSDAIVTEPVFAMIF